MERKSLAGGGEDIVVVGLFAKGEVSSLEAGVNYIASGSSMTRDNVDYDTQVGRAVRMTWA